MYGYNYNQAFSNYNTGNTHGNYEERETWQARSPPNYALPAPYQYHDYERPRGASGAPPLPLHHGTSTCTNNCCCPRTSQHQQTLRHHPQTWQDSRQEYYQNSLNQANPASMSVERSSVITHDFYEQGHLPNDPREWSAHDVFLWVNWAARNYRINNAFPERFQMNGKALCLMDVSMFLYRVPQGGEMLYQDFQCRLQRAVGDERTYSR